MEENINVFDFALDASDMNAIRALDEKESLFSLTMIQRLQR